MYSFVTELFEVVGEIVIYPVKNRKLKKAKNAMDNNKKRAKFFTLLHLTIIQITLLRR